MIVEIFSTYREDDVDSVSEGLQENTNTLGKDFSTLLNSNSRVNCEMTADFVRLIMSELASQMAKKLDGIKIDINSETLQAINFAITESMIPELQGLGTL